MSLTTAISDDEIDRSGSPASTRPINSAASFNCTGAVRKAGFLSVKKWLIRKKHKVSINLYNLWKLLKKVSFLTQKATIKLFDTFGAKIQTLFSSKKRPLWVLRFGAKIQIWIVFQIFEFWRQKSRIKLFDIFGAKIQTAKRYFLYEFAKWDFFRKIIKCDILSYFQTMWGVCISLSLEKLRQNSGRKRFSFLYFFCTAGWVGQEARLERLLGVLERHNFTFLSLWVQRRSKCGSHTSASHYRRRIHYAEHSRASKERLHFLLIDGLWRCLSLPGNCEWRPKRKGNSEWVLNN